MGRLENIKTTTNDIITRQAEHFIFDRYDYETLSQFLSDLRDRTIGELEKAISAQSDESDTKLVAKLTTTAAILIDKVGLKLVAIDYEAKQHEDLLGEDGTMAIANGIELIAAVKEFHDEAELVDALEAVKGIKSELVKVHFKKPPIFPLKRDQLNAVESDKHVLNEGPKGHEDHKHLLNQPHECAFEIIELCLSVIEDANVVMNTIGR